MATSLDTRLVPRIKTLVEKYGLPATFVTQSETYDPATGVTTLGSPTNHSVTVTPPAPYRRGYVPGSDVPGEDLEALLYASGLAFTPAAGQKATVDGQTFRVVSVSPLYTGEQVGAYVLQLRR